MSAKKAVGCLLVLMMTVSVPVYADGPVEKFGRGVTNIVTSPVEYMNSYQSLAQNQGYLTSFLGAILYGTLLTAGRIVGGAYEVVTFLIPLPEDYNPLMDPPTPIAANQSSWGKGSVRD